MEINYILIIFGTICLFDIIILVLNKFNSRNSYEEKIEELKQRASDLEEKMIVKVPSTKTSFNIDSYRKHIIDQHGWSTVMPDRLSTTLKEFGSSTEECVDSFKKLRYGLETVNETRSRYGMSIFDDNYEIRDISYHYQCDYCGAFYKDHITNCKNCGALIRPRTDCIISRGW